MPITEFQKFVTEQLIECSGRRKRSPLLLSDSGYKEFLDWCRTSPKAATIIENEPELCHFLMNDEGIYYLVISPSTVTRVTKRLIEAFENKALGELLSR